MTNKVEKEVEQLKEVIVALNIDLLQQKETTKNLNDVVRLVFSEIVGEQESFNLQEVLDTLKYLKSTAEQAEQGFTEQAPSMEVDEG